MNSIEGGGDTYPERLSTTGTQAALSMTKEEQQAYQARRAEGT